ncbi:ABC transporter ATP-binding protein [Metallococcus carri]|nr:ABC transporter ATP-binding protein [Metallococcus carri]
MQNTPPIVSFRSVTKEYGTGAGAVRALDDVTVDIRAGEFTAIMGPSGSGKSTFMNVAAGLDDVTRGEVLVTGQPVHRMTDQQRTLLRRDRVGFVFQAFNLVPTLSAAENIELPFELAGRTLDGETRRWIEHLSTVLGLRDRLGHHPAQLSGGQQQRVAIARALASRPAIVFADEPTGNLDTRTSREVLTLLRTACGEYGQTIAMVSHDPVAASYADRVLVIADGRIAADHNRLAPQDISRLLIGLETAA